MSEDVPSNRKPIIKLVVLGLLSLLLLGILGGGGWFAYQKIKAARLAKIAAQTQVGNGQNMNSEDAEETEGSESSEPAEGEGAKNAGPPVLVYKNNVNLEGKRNAYLVVELHILFRDPELGKKSTSDSQTPENSMIRAMILDLLSGKSLEEVTDTETREAIRLEIKEKLNEKFAPKPPAPGEKADKKTKRPKHPVKDVLIVSWAIAQ